MCFNKLRLRLKGAFFAITALVMLSLSACGGDESAIVGTWESRSPEITLYDTIVFNKNGSGTISAENTDFEFTYELIGECITMSVDFFGTIDVQQVVYALKDDVLTFDYADYERR